MEPLISYEVLKLIWWGLIGVLLVGFAIFDGYDLGSAGLLTYIGKTDTERRVIINAVAPHWDGNQVWLITAGGAIFAAWPMVYATAFSGFYWAMLLVLFALIFRPVSFEYRAKVEPHHQKLMDIALVISGVVPALLFGVAFGNLFLGYGFTLDQFLRSTFQENFFDLLHPFALLCGVVSLSMILMQGANWLNLRTDGIVRERAVEISRYLSIAVLVSFALAGLWITFMPGYVVTEIDPAGIANPLDKTVVYGERGAWLNNYFSYPLIMLAPLFGFAGAAGSLLLARKMPTIGFICSSLANAGIILTAGFSLFPFIMPSSSDPGMSMTMWDATSSPLTLGIMTFVAALFVPIVLSYTMWCFYKMWGRVDEKHIETNTHSLY